MEEYSAGSSELSDADATALELPRCLAMLGRLSQLYGLGFRV